MVRLHCRHFTSPTRSPELMAASYYYKMAPKGAKYRLETLRARVTHCLYGNRAKSSIAVLHARHFTALTFLPFPNSSWRWSMARNGST